MVEETRARLADAEAELGRLRALLDALPPHVSSPARARRPRSTRVDRALADRIPAEVTAMEPDLDRIRALMDVLGSPQRSYPSIHLTGTNGKTSTARMIDALLRAFGLRPGRYTQPAPVDRHRADRIDGVPLDEERVRRRRTTRSRPYLALVDSRRGAAGDATSRC